MQREALAPMTVGQILDRSFRLYRQNFVRFIAIVAVIQVPMFLIGLIIHRIMSSNLQAAQSGPAEVNYAAIFVPLLVAAILGILATTLSNAALLKSISGAYLGQRVSVGEAYREVLPRLLPLIGAALLVAMIVGAGFILLVIPGIILALMYALTTQSMVCEKLGALKGMNRSRQLTSGSKGKVFIVWLVLLILTVLVGALFTRVGGFIMPAATPDNNMIRLVISSVSESLGQIAVMPLSAGVFVLLYYDMRIRKEGFDLEMLAQSVGMEIRQETVTDAGDPPTA